VRVVPVSLQEELTEAATMKEMLLMAGLGTVKVVAVTRVIMVSKIRPIPRPFVGIT
jgi:hypothetical protein